MFNTGTHFDEVFGFSKKFRRLMSSHVEVKLPLVSEIPSASRAAMDVDLDTKMTGQVDLEVGVVLERPSTQSASKYQVSYLFSKIQSLLLEHTCEASLVFLHR